MERIFKRDIFNDWPRVSDLRKTARRKMPHFAWEYIDSGTGEEFLMDANREAFKAVRMMPQFMRGSHNVNLSTSLLGEKYDFPFGIAPIGMSGLMWPGAEHMLARVAAKNNIPYCLSTVACEAPETVGPICDGNGWFQLYVPAERTICMDLLERAWKSGFKVLIVTVDVPVPSTRERHRKAGMKVPPNNDLRTLVRAAMRPHWAMASVVHGLPRFKTIEKYAETDKLADVASFLGRELSENFNLEYLKLIIDAWPGKVLIKGVLDERDAKDVIALGVDGIIVSNHGGRQFDAAPSALERLPTMVKLAKGKCAVLFDSGVRTGLDVIKALALGADFVLLGRAFMYGVTALQERGGQQVVDLLEDDITNNLKQLGVKKLSDLPARLHK